MVRIKEEKKILTPAETREVKRLERQADRLLDHLALCPSDPALISALNELDIKIVRITQEKTIDY